MLIKSPDIARVFNIRDQLVMRKLCRVLDLPFLPPFSLASFGFFISLVTGWIAKTTLLARHLHMRVQEGIIAGTR
jgi:hypothetical protein